MANNILLIEDDSRLAEMIVDYLDNSGFNVTIANTGQYGLELQKRKGFDAVLLDLMLPDIDGLEICRQLRAKDSIPILMLTAKGEPLDRILGLELGADDYLPKPFEPRELLARLKAVLRRGSIASFEKEGREPVLTFGSLEIDPNAMEARLDGNKCDLTTHQFNLLKVLAERAGRVMSRNNIMNALKGNDLEAFDRSIDVHISRIRSEIEDDPNKPRRVITVRGVGYVFARTQE